MRTCQTMKFLILYAFLQVIVTSALAQSDGVDDYLPIFCPSDIDQAAYKAADNTNEKVKIKACQWLRDDEQGRKANARNADTDEDRKLYFGFAASQFSPHQERGDWASSRPLTYQSAYLDLATEYASEQYGNNIRSVAEQKGFRQRGLNPDALKCYPNETESKWYNRVIKNRVVKKGVVLLEKKLDEALIEMNVDPSSLSGDSPQETLARRVGKYIFSLEETTRREINPSKVSGLVIINTFEVVEGASASIGVLARWSDEVYTMTRLMAEHKGNLPKDYPRGAPGKKVGQWINAIKRDLGHNFGVQIVRDENGYPVLLAFGHSARRYFGSDLQERRDDKQFALDISAEEAYAQLADYVAATLEFARTTNKKIDEFDGYELFHKNGQCIPDQVRKKQFKEIITSTWNVRSKLDNFKGARLKYEGVIKHPLVEGVEIAVSVVAWSPEISAKPLIVKKSKKESDVVKKPSGALSGKALGDSYDF